MRTLVVQHVARRRERLQTCGTRQCRLTLRFRCRFPVTALVALQIACVENSLLHSGHSIYFLLQFRCMSRVLCVRSTDTVYCSSHCWVKHQGRVKHYPFKTSPKFQCCKTNARHSLLDVDVQVPFRSSLTQCHV